ncbi:MAG: alpha/beta hydrolase [Gammaproteobacteria bacterium]|nr:alpha/beta hydrolase [Gammaproteobacteria bacterium]
MDKMILLRIKNQILGTLAPSKVAKDHVKIFLSPRRFPLKNWEENAELEGERLCFGKEFEECLSALRWGKGGDKRVLIMHGWESRATQMYTLAQPLLEQGYEVIAIDAPRHGLSKGKRANPVQFASSVVAACRELGPFHAAIGHSMGCAGLAMAREKGASITRLVLLASPANMLDNLQAFADFMKLPKKCTEIFINGIGITVGCPADELDVGKMLSTGQPEVLLVHDRNDIEVPFSSMARIYKKLSNARTWESSSLGHRKLVRDPDIATIVAQFVGTGDIARTTYADSM